MSVPPNAPELPEGAERLDDSEFATAEERELERQFHDYLRALERGAAPDLESFLKQVAPDQGPRLKRLIEALTARERSVAGPPPVEVGRDVGDCRIVSPLGRGGTGSVWLCEQKSTDRLVALKMLHAGVLATERARQRFEREWRSIAKLHHPNIVPLYTAGEYHGAPYFTMGRVDGRSLSDVLQLLKPRAPELLTGLDLRAAVLGEEVAGGASEATTDEASIFRRGYVESVCRLVIRMADALAHAHEAGLIHRDVKPSNILITRQGVPMLLDFGLAHDEKSTSITRTGEFAGTYHYVSPEQAAASRMGIDLRTDVYSLGVVLYQLLTLKLPFDGATTQEIIKQVLVKEPVPPRRLNALIPRDLEMIVLKAMDKDPDRRYARAGDFAADLQNLIDLKPVQARPLSSGERLRRFVRRNPAPSIAAAIVFLALTGLLGFLWWSGVRRAQMVSTQLGVAEQYEHVDRIPEALSVYEAVLHFAPGALAAREGKARCETALQKARSGAAQLVQDVLHQIEEYRRRRALAVPCREQLALANVPAYHTPEVIGRLRAAARELDQWRSDRERLCARVLADLDRAEHLDPQNGEIHSVRLALSIERFREAVDEGDSEQRALLLEEVCKLTSDQALIDDLVGNAPLQLIGQPAHARAYLFRWQRQDTFRAGGDARLVPVPAVKARAEARGASEWADGFWPGDRCGVVTRVDHASVAERAGLAAGDLIVAMNDRLLGDGLFVSSIEPGGQADQHGVRCFDQLVGIRSFDCKSRYDIEPPILQERGLNLQRVAVHFRRWMTAGDAEYSLSLPLEGSIERALNATLSEPVDLLSCAAAAEAVTLRCVVSGAEREIVWPAGTVLGAHLELTANPLIFAADNMIGELPHVERMLESGSYLLVLRCAGHADLRLPFLIEAGKGITITASMLPEHALLPEFVCIPANAFQRESDARAAGSTRAGPAPQQDFFMCRHEVTFGEYLQFLNDPETVAERRANPRRNQVPRSSWFQPDGYLRQNPDGTYRTPAELILDVPAVGVSFEDAIAYCQWRNRKAQREGLPWRFFLPRIDQWETAASGADARLFPWGNVFDDWSLTKSSLARPDAPVVPESCMRFPTDESPYGVRDMAGNASEWTLYRETEDQQQILRGGNWGDTSIDSFRCSAMVAITSWFAAPTIGFRLCAVPEDR
ncbi:MAG: SUMF1/EgtB/PvdO family nonheme iron enzyme [Planctomycetota bacterium]